MPFQLSKECELNLVLPVLGPCALHEAAEYQEPLLEARCVLPYMAHHV